MKNHENFEFNPEQTPEEFIESLRHTEAGQEMEKMPEPTPEVLEESGEKHKICWEGMTGNSGCSEYMPKEKAQKWMGMLREAYPDPFYNHWLESEKEESKKN